MHEDFESPFNLIWDTIEETTGEHVIVAEAVVDDDEYSDTYTVTVTTSWSYLHPEQINDGWETASLGSVGMDSTHLVSLMNTLCGSEDHRITVFLLPVTDGSCSRSTSTVIAETTKIHLSTSIAI